MQVAAFGGGYRLHLQDIPERTWMKMAHHGRAIYVEEKFTGEY
jgi:hypothetical protein